ncbi:olfactory receptor 1F1-like [Tiliqua scincoides]|uniref:olfactory receptor 1F1-like n=1 Tax=Tiliqua scincoides TaxID=71010 RepID=UPI003462DDF9
MGQWNETSPSEFILLGITTRPELQCFFSVLFFSTYLLTLLGNLLIVLLVYWDPSLFHTPMYFFLSNLSLADIGFTSATIPKMLQTLLSESTAISYSGCFTQMYFFFAFANTDNFLLASMAYDRYVAICHPLHYATLMNHKRCLLMAGIPWLVSIVLSLMYTVLASRLSFCVTREIPHFFCDIQPLMRISCSDTKLLQTLVMSEGLIDVSIPFLLIVISYVCIFYAVLRVPSAAGKLKAFSTCGSHLTVVILFYSTLIWVYFQPPSRNAGRKDTVAAIMYTVVTPMLNPFIYTLRNNEIKGAVRRVMSRMKKTLSEAEGQMLH